jgi:hypothetical protein
MGGPKNKPYRRSWKNLLLNKSYQLRFTLFMVGLSTLLMTMLGWWVLRVADTATQVAVNSLLSFPCQEPSPPERPAAVEERENSGAVNPHANGDKPGHGKVVVETEMRIVDSSETGGAPSREGGANGRDESPSGDENAAAEETYREDMAAFTRCRETQQSEVVQLEERRDLIGIVLLAVGILLTIGLFLYGIIMTHKVAGPLFKVSLYLEKLRQGKYDTVYNLRKGDQLVAFYEHFKAAHQGLRRMQEDDIGRLRAVVAAADRENLAQVGSEIAASLEELRILLKDKEASLDG